MNRTNACDAAPPPAFALSRGLAVAATQAVNTHCFAALFSIPQHHQKLVVDSIIWAFKHTERNVAETGLEILLALLQNVGRPGPDGQSPALAQAFYQVRQRSFWFGLAWVW